MISWVQATNEIIRLLGLHDNYSSLPETERMNLLAEAISSPPPVERVEVCFLPSCCEVLPKFQNC
jgi:phosphoenolpyruvate carboxylase